ncbi:MAG: S41 family peptidase [Bacteroidota bacterium]
MKSLRLYLLFQLCLFITSPLDAQSEQNMPTDLAKKEINNIFTRIKSVHADAFFKNSESEVLAYKDSLFQHWSTPQLSCRQFLADGMKLVALMSNGHTSLDWLSDLIYPDVKQYLFLPIIIKNRTPNGLEVEAISKKSKKLNGKLLKTINGVSAVEIYDNMLQYQGGNQRFKESYMGIMFGIYAFFDQRLKAPYLLDFVDGTSSELKGIKAAKMNKLVTKKSDTDFSYGFSILDDHIGLLTYNRCDNLPKFKAFLQEVFAAVKKENVQKLIVDIRKNSGGDSRLNDELLNYLTSEKYRQMAGRYWKVSQSVKDQIQKDSLWANFMPASFLQDYLALPNDSLWNNLDTTLTTPIKNEYYFDGKWCLLVGPATFSSANMLADACKTFKLAPLIGQPTGELTNDYGEMVTFYLESAKTYLYIASTYDIGADGNAVKRSVVLPDFPTDKPLEFATKWLLEN